MSVENISSVIESRLFLFENRSVKVVALKNMPKIDLASFSVGPFEEGREYEVKFWVARILEEEGIIRVLEVRWNSASNLPNIHFAERQTSTPSPIPSDFYPMVRRLMEELKAASIRSAEKAFEYEWTKNLLNDIIDLRISKVITLTLLQNLDMQALRNLTFEEKALYESIRNIIAEWRAKIL